MGICASCLGHNRRPSHIDDETDALLGSSVPAQYGGFGDAEDIAQPDEEELRREREEYERITAAAADNMIDVAHPDAAAISQNLKHSGHERHGSLEHEGSRDAYTETGDSEDEEAAWLRSVQEADDAPVAQVKGLQSGKIVMDLRQLREEHTGSPSRR